MKSKYLDFIADKYLLECITNLHKSYVKAKNNISKKDLYSNKIDTIKLTFDSKFNGIDEESLIQSEILRQIDKSISNSIGTFHEQQRIRPQQSLKNFRPPVLQFGFRTTRCVISTL